MSEWGADTSWGRFLKDAASAVQPSANDTSLSLIKKTDDELQIVYGEVYAPGIPDSQGDYMTRETIQKMAHEFMRKGLVNKIDVNHSQQESGSYVVESFIAPDDGKVFIPGSWVIGVKVPDQQTWQAIKSGDLNGFSLDGYGVRVDTVLEIETPDVLKGETDNTPGHQHTFYVRYAKNGDFLGGETSAGPDGHIHKIQRGTVTEVAKDHSHRFSFVEGILNVQVRDQSH